MIGINTWQSGAYSFAIDVRHLVALREKLVARKQPLAKITGPDEQLKRILVEFQQRAQWYHVELMNKSTQQIASVTKFKAKMAAFADLDLGECQP